MPTSIFKKNFPGVEKIQGAVDITDYVIGLDLHKKTTAICVIDPHKPDEPLFQRKRLKNENLITTLQSFIGKKIVACEAAYGWFPLRDALNGMQDVTFVPLDSHKTSSWIKTSGIKSDKVDAQILCHVCIHGGINCLAVHQPERRARECCKLAQHREQLVRQQTRLKNRLGALDRDCGVNPYTGEVTNMSDLLRYMKKDIENQLEDINQRIRSAENRMTCLSKNDNTVKLLQSIPGIGPITAFILRNKIEDISRFKDPAHLSSYFGLAVRQRQSGDHIVKGKITKTGNTLVRKLLVQGAQIIRFRHPEYFPLYFPKFGQEKLMGDPRHANKVVVALARKHLTFVWHVWKNSEPFSIDRYRERRRQVQSIAPSSKKVAELDCLFALQGRKTA